MSGLTTEVPISTIVWTGITQGLGLGSIFVPISTVTFSTLAPHSRNEGTAMFSLIRHIRSSIGISTTFTLLHRTTQVNHADMANLITPFPAAIHSPWPDRTRA